MRRCTQWEDSQHWDGAVMYNSPLDIIRYGPKRGNALRALGRQAARQTFQRIDRLRWDSLYYVDEEQCPVPHASLRVEHDVWPR